MHLTASRLVGAFVLVAGLTSTSAHSIHRRGSQQHHKDLAERMAQPDANAAQDDAANFYARALNDAQAGKYRITRRAANPVGRAGQKKVIRKRADGATCKIRPSGQNATENASPSAASSTAGASTASEWWATSVGWFFAFLHLNTDCCRNSKDCRGEQRRLVVLQLSMGRALRVLHLGSRTLFVGGTRSVLRDALLVVFLCRSRAYSRDPSLQWWNRHQSGHQQRLAGHQRQRMWPM